MSSYFGTPAEVEAARAKRRAEVRAWAAESQAEADRIVFGDFEPIQWDYIDEEEDEEDNDAIDPGTADPEEQTSAEGPGDRQEPEGDPTIVEDSAGEASVEPGSSNTGDPEDTGDLVEKPKTARKSPSKGSTAAK